MERVECGGREGAGSGLTMRSTGTSPALYAQIVSSKVKDDEGKLLQNGESCSSK